VQPVSGILNGEFLIFMDGLQWITKAGIILIIGYSEYFLALV
jgi:hypothetical protein